MNKVDAAGLKFKILRDLGEDVDISFVKFNKEIPTKLYVRGHEYSDGLGFFADLFEHHYKEKIGTLPVARTKNIPGLLKRFLYFCIHIIRQRPRNYHWQRSGDKTLGKSKGFCHFTFSREQGIDIARYCHDKKISINSLFIKLFDEVASEQLLTNSIANEKRVWMIPVSLRTKDQANLRYGNFVTTLSIYTDNNSTPRSLYKQMSKMLKSGLPWGGLWVANISKLLGEKRMRKMSNKDVKAPYVGLITNLGKWSFDNMECKEDRWILVAPVSRFAPVSISLFEWNEEISLTMQLHPMLKRNLRESEELFRSAINKLALVINKEIAMENDLIINWRDINELKSII